MLLDPIKPAIRPTRRPNITDASFQTSSTVPNAASPDGSRAAAVVTGRPVAGSGPNRYDDDATSQYGSGGLRM